MARSHPIPGVPFEPRPDSLSAPRYTLLDVAIRAAGDEVLVTWHKSPTNGEPSVQMEFPDGTAYFSTPDNARALGIALIEASGLALGAQVAQQRAAADDVGTEAVRKHMQKLKRRGLRLIRPSFLAKETKA